MVKVKRGLIVTIASVMLISSFVFGVSAQYIEEVLHSYDHYVFYGQPYADGDDNYTYTNLRIPTGYGYSRGRDTVTDITPFLLSGKENIEHHVCNYTLHRV